MQVVDHYENPRNVGSFDKNDPNVGTGLVGAPACGDVMKLQIKVDENGDIIDACFKTFGCGSAIASSSVGMFTNLYVVFMQRGFWVLTLFKNGLIIGCREYVEPEVSLYYTGVDPFLTEP